ncbi:hypothetical protein L2E82_20643 [Cichorium intybus]|uniref:Uncharacterized protein n=1 Tax=Cichorium intybus TaxID=13427 RepID=A0ACB9DTN2_CICIN|nr:hypothetical protein L2E82_20643 [Cichorium intybus]
MGRQKSSGFSDKDRFGEGGSLRIILPVLPTATCQVIHVKLTIGHDGLHLRHRVIAWIFYLFIGKFEESTYSISSGTHFHHRYDSSNGWTSVLHFLDFPNTTASPNSTSPSIGSPRRFFHDQVLHHSIFEDWIGILRRAAKGLMFQRSTS